MDTKDVEATGYAVPQLTVDQLKDIAGDKHWNYRMYSDGVMIFSTYDPKTKEESCLKQCDKFTDFVKYVLLVLFFMSLCYLASLKGLGYT